MTTICSKCLASIDLLLKNQNLSPEILGEFISESLDLSLNHFRLIEGTLNNAQKSKYRLKHMQAELMLSILRRLQSNCQ